VRGLAANDRPREKLGRLGPSGLGDNELLAIVIGGGAPGVGALGLANNVLEAAGGLHGLLRLTPDDLCQIGGVGTARAAQVLAALELGRRSLVRRTPERRRLVSPRDVAELLLPEFGARPVEQFGVVLLDTKHRVLRTVIVSSGGLDSTPVQVRDVFRHAAVGAAAAVVVFHNHPSGDPRPSEDDLRLTARLVAAGELMGVPVLDHVVLGDGRYWSCKEMGGLRAG
jgi:DNA repair protein RadC